MKKFRFKGIHIVSNLITSVITAGTANAITLFPFVFYRTKYAKNNIITRTHEIIHIQQQTECGLVGVVVSCSLWLILHNWLISLSALFLFYILYLVFYIINLIKFKNRNQAYHDIPFENEAYLNANFKYYPDMRRWFAWLKYL